MSVSGLDTILHNLAEQEQRLYHACVDAMEEIMALLESYAKTHHLWRPVTGSTDASTRGEIERVTRDAVLGKLSTGTDYSVYLELAHGGKYAWLVPAIEANQQNIVSIIQRRLSV